MNLDSFLSTILSHVFFKWLLASLLLSNCNFSDHFTQGSLIPWVLLRLKQDKHLQEVSYLIFAFFSMYFIYFYFFISFSFEFPTAFLPNFFLTILHFIMSVTKKDLSKSSLKLISQECSCRSPYLLQGALTGVEVLQGIYAFGFMWRFPERRPINCIRTSKSTGPKKLKNYYYCIICFFPATSRKC